MSNLNIVRRRASDSEANRTLALISNQHIRIPPPLPYLPSDYQPSPDSPRRILITSPSNPIASSTSKPASSQSTQSYKRQRSHSTNYALTSESQSPPTTPNTLIPRKDSYELVPYRDWTIISQNNQKGQLVLYNQNNQSVTVEHYLPEQLEVLNANVPVDIKIEEGFCPYCHSPMMPNQTSARETSSEPDYMDRNYFRLLASSQVNTASNTPTQSRSNTFSTDSEKPPDLHKLNENAFNQGYYENFFTELNRLGKGFRGSVFLCEHKLDGVKLGKYAIKKVAIGNNHPWLVRMLREVHLLERLRHPNIVSYKHSWLEYNQLTPFGPKVPCLFILMECANGGNLEEYLEFKMPQNQTSSTEQHNKEQQQTKGKKRADLKRERIKRQYKAQEAFEDDKNISAPVSHVNKRLLTMNEISSLFLDIVQGLAHLHQQNIVHRDLKPPNLLLQYDVRNRNAHQGIPRILISDFGECEDLDDTHEDENRTGATGTLEFMAPEHVRLDPRGRNTVEYSPKADMWSLGMVLFYLCYSMLPYSVIDDVDILRSEILAFKEIKFPTSRLDIYNNDPELYSEAYNNPNITSDIPNELKILIRMLLSVDPSKRPSCQEILHKLRSFQRDENAYVFKDIPTDWKTKNHRSPHKSRAVSADAPRRSFAQPTAKKPILINPEHLTHTTSTISEERETEENPDMVSSPVDIQHRQESIFTNHSIQEKQEESRGSPSRLLIESPGIVEQQVDSWFSDQLFTRLIKTITIILKIASCTYTCSPYSVKATTLYPVILVALLDFWDPVKPPNFVLLVFHICWVTAATWIGDGLCAA